MAKREARERLRADVLQLSNEIGPRPAGTTQDDLALNFIKERSESLGLAARVEEFPFMKSEATEWGLGIAGHELTSLPCLSSPSTTGSLRGSLAYVGYGTDREIRGVRGKIILAKIGRVHESIIAERAAKEGALGAIFFAGGGAQGIYTARVRYPIGSIPALCVASNAGLRLSTWARRGHAVEMYLKARTKEGRGKNLCAGTEGQDGEYITVTAHRDSRPHSPGANDNASGAALMMDVALRLASLRLPGGILFLSTDAEEYGLRGSLHHVKARRAALRKCVANVNLDSVGQGSLHLVQKDRQGALSSSLNRFGTKVASGLGLKVHKIETQNGSDCDPFMEAGVDATWIRGWPNSSFNCTADTSEKIDYELMESASEYVTRFVEDLSRRERWKRTIRN